MERILRKHITRHIETYNLISEHQHGFVRRSCQTNLLEALEDWTRTLDEGSALDIVYLDYQKAFDTQSTTPKIGNEAERIWHQGPSLEFDLRLLV